MPLLTPTEMGREFGMHRRAVITKCMELGVPIFQGRIDKLTFRVALEQSSVAPRESLAADSPASEGQSAPGATSTGAPA